MHHGILLDDGQVLHNTPFRGEHLSSLGEFSKGRKVNQHPPASEATSDPSRLREAISERRRYNPFTNNCEHTVNRVVSGKARSEQLEALIAGTVTGAAGLVLTRSLVVAAVGFKVGTILSRRLKSRHQNIEENTL